MYEVKSNNVLELYEYQCTDDDSMNASYLCYGDYDDDAGTPTTCDILPELLEK